MTNKPSATELAVCAKECTSNGTCEGFDFDNKNCRLALKNSNLKGGDGKDAAKKCYTITRPAADANVPIASTKDATEKMMCMSRNKDAIGKVIPAIVGSVQKDAFTKAISDKITALKKDDAKLWTDAIKGSLESTAKNLKEWVEKDDTHKANLATLQQKVQDEAISMWFMLI